MGLELYKMQIQDVKDKIYFNIAISIVYLLFIITFIVLSIICFLKGLIIGGIMSMFNLAIYVILSILIIQDIMELNKELKEIYKEIARDLYATLNTLNKKEDK